MRTAIAAALVMLALCPPAAAQTAPPSPPASACEPKQALLGGIGRASVVAFTGAVFGDRVCATVATIAIDGFAATLAPAPGANALVDAALGTGTGATLVVSPYALGALAEGPAPAGAATARVGPFVVAPGGTIPNFNGDTASLPRVVLAFAGQNLLLIGTTNVTLVDLAKALRDQPDLFGADAVERAVVLASGSNAALALRTADGTFGSAALPAAQVLELTKR